MLKSPNKILKHQVQASKSSGKLWRRPHVWRFVSSLPASTQLGSRYLCQNKRVGHGELRCRNISHTASSWLQNPIFLFIVTTHSTHLLLLGSRVPQRSPSFLFKKYGHIQMDRLLSKDTPFFKFYIFKACHQTSSERMWHSTYSAYLLWIKLLLKNN